jgi:hypothetical protein
LVSHSHECGRKYMLTWSYMYLLCLYKFVVCWPLFNQQSSKWTFGFIGANQILEFIFIYSWIKVVNTSEEVM